ncbi:MAG: COQ9 family protein [Rubricella sp.]
MSENTKTEAEYIAEAREALLDAALIHVTFDGWSDAALKAAIRETGTDPGLARLAFPRGGIDMALAFHARGDRRLAQELAATDLAAMGVTAKVTHAIRRRLEIVAADREAVRRGTALLALPHHAGEGARALWQTADTIWNAIGDTSRDVNWYTKRMTLSGVYSATVLYWLGDEQPGFGPTWEFLDRRIADVMRIEKAKARFRESPFGKAFRDGPGRFLSRLSAPEPRDDLPGHTAR